MEFKKILYSLKKLRTSDCHRAAILISVAALLISCSEFQPLEVGKFYKRDMGIEINGVYKEGVTTTKRADRYEIIIEPKGADPDLIILRTCHREDAFEKDEKTFWFIPMGSNKFKYIFEPVKGIEDVKVCPLRGDAFESDDNQTSWFFLEFEAPHVGYTLQADLTCNGEKRLINGVGACQARRGLIQILEFKEEVRFAPTMPAECSDPKHVGNYRYEIELSLGECLLHAENRLGELLRLTTIGYEGVLVRKPQ